MPGKLETNLIRRIAVGDMLRRRAADRASAEVIVEYIDGERRSLSFADFNRRVNQLVYGLRARGIRQGDRVAILGANSSQFLTALLGCFKGGFVAVPINFLQNAEDVAYNIQHSGARALFADAALRPLLAGIGYGSDDRLLLGELLPLPDAGESRFVPLDELLAGQPATEIEDIVIDDDDLAQIMYTSGTTARPKGVMLSHKNIFLSSLNGGLTIGVARGRANGLAVLPVFHITAEMLFLTSMHLGCKTVVMRGFDPDTVLRCIETEQLHSLMLLPLMWKALLASPRIAEHDYSSLGSALYAMAPMDHPTLQALETTFGCPFMIGSGQTETTAISTLQDASWNGVKQGNYWGDGSITTDQAVMGENGRLLGPGEVGEVVWRGPQVMLGYYHNEEATLEAQAGGWHHSGDQGFIDEDNQFCFVDRKKDIVKSGGENVSSVKVERAILALPGVANVGVIGVPHAHWGEAVTAVIQLAPGADISEERVISHCKAHLGGFEVPKKIVKIDALPMTATGKVKKHELRARFADLYSL